MHFAFDEEQQAVRDGARRFLDDVSNSEQVRAAIASDVGWDRGLWRRIASELGWTALTIDEAYGGLGMGPVALVGLVEEMGRALLCAPFFSTICLAAPTLAGSGDGGHKQRWLRAIAEGGLTATVAWMAERGPWDPANTGVVVEPIEDGYRLDGEAHHVIDGHSAELLIVAARHRGSEGQQGISLFGLAADSAGVSRRGLSTMDSSRRLSTVDFAGVRLDKTALLAEDEVGYPVLRRALDLACVALSAEQVGIAERCLSMAVQYAGIRQQFGRPIGSFQAIKHKCADMLVAVESARSASYWAGWTAAEQPQELALAASLAQSDCSEAAFLCAAENIQVHGGIGFTWEHDAHLYFKRARSNAALLGSASWHRQRIADLIDLSGEAP